MTAGEMVAATVPMVRTLNLEFLESTAERAVVRLPDQTDFHNHLGGPHAGAMFTLAESASGAIVIAAFGDQLTRAVPLAVKAEIGYQKLAMGRSPRPPPSAGRRPKSSQNWTRASAPSFPWPSGSSARTAR